jgi:hypothetical protein
MGALLTSLLALTAAAAPRCQPEFAQSLGTLKATEVDERAMVALGLVGELCKDAISPALARTLSAIAYAKDEERPAMLGAAGKPEESGADYELACPGWSKLLSNADVFKSCDFARHEVFTAAEFGKAEARLATLAVVTFDALKRAGVDKKFARQLMRAVLLPLEAGPAPVHKDVTKDKEKMKAIMKSVLEQKD